MRTPPAEMSGRYLYDVDPVDGEEAWALFEACRDGDLARVSVLIEHDPALVHAQHWYTQPIHFAVYANRPAVVRVLLDAGAEPGPHAFHGLRVEETGPSSGRHGLPGGSRHSRG